MKSTFLYKDCCHRTTASVKLCLDNNTSCISVRISFKLMYLCCKKNHLEKFINTFLSMCRYRYKYCRTAPVFCNKTIFCKFLLNFFNICIRLINLIYCYDNFNISCLCMVNSLYCLWHNTIICCYYKNSNICCLCTTHSHSCKCLMTRCIKKCY